MPRWQANPFLYDADGEVRIDLSGAGGQGGTPVLMGPDVAVAFSLPSVAAGDNDAMGMATVQVRQVDSESAAVLVCSLADCTLDHAAGSCATGWPTCTTIFSGSCMR